MKKEKQQNKKFIELVERLLERWGYNRTEGKIYAVLLMNGKPMTISELAKSTGLSRSSVSIALSNLTRDYLVTYRKEGKTKYFSAVPVFLEKFLKQPQEMLEREVLPLKKVVESLLESTESDEKRTTYEAILSDLSALECVLKRLIEFEERDELCFKKESS